MEAEARVILAASVGAGRPSTGLGSHIRAQFKDIESTPLAVPERTGVAGTVEFGA